MNKKAAAEVDEEVLARFRREQVNLQESLQESLPSRDNGTL